jgi:hypothetical protein
VENEPPLPHQFTHYLQGDHGLPCPGPTLNEHDRFACGTGEILGFVEYGVVGRDLVVNQIEDLLLVDHLARVFEQFSGGFDWACDKPSKYFQTVPGRKPLFQILTERLDILFCKYRKGFDFSFEFWKKQDCFGVCS